MLVKNIVLNVCKFLSLEGVINYLNNGDEIDEDISQKLNNLIVSCNLASSNIATNYLPIKMNTKVVVKGGKIEYKNLTNFSIAEIVSLRKNKSLYYDYKVFSDGLEMADGEYEICYLVYPSEVGIDDEINCFTKIDEMIFSQLVTSEYLFLNGFIDEANNWKVKFDECMKSILKCKKNVVMPKRRWM